MGIKRRSSNVVNLKICGHVIWPLVGTNAGTNAARGTFDTVYVCTQNFSTGCTWNYATQCYFNQELLHKCYVENSLHLWNVKWGSWMVFPTCACQCFCLWLGTARFFQFLLRLCALTTIFQVHYLLSLPWRHRIEAKLYKCCTALLTAASV